MLGLFLRPDAVEQIARLDLRGDVRHRALEVIEKGYTVIPGALSPEACRDTTLAFREFERKHDDVFGPNRDQNGHYPRIVNLHSVFPEIAQLFTRNAPLLDVLDTLFGARASLYTSLFYEVGSQQPMHRDTPLFATRPEYLYFGVTVYLEPTDDENGCLEVLEGGHKIAEVDREAMAVRHHGSIAAVPALDWAMWGEYQADVIEQAKAGGIEPKKVHVRAGDTLIWHPQLPHGGTAIVDVKRTRLSLVMHVTPERVPVYHQNAFFAPSADFPTTPSWGFYRVDGREIADHRTSGVSFGHQATYSVNRF